MTEHDIQSRIVKDLSGPDIRLFIANAGTAWQGRGQPIRLDRGFFQSDTGRRRHISGGIYLRGGYRIELLPEGFSDVFGARRTEITKDMVGGAIAQAIVIEVKKPGKKASSKQRPFLDMASDLGCRSGVATSTEEAWSIIL